MNCFVLMSFDAEMEKVYEGAIREACRATDYEAVRADSPQGMHDVSEWILESIVGADVIIADLSHPKPNVYFELGVALALHKPTICISGTDALPFDVRNYRVTVYNPADLQGLFLRLREQLRGIDKFRTNPVSKAATKKFAEHLDAIQEERRRTREYAQFSHRPWADNAPVANRLIEKIWRYSAFADGRGGVIAISGAGSVGKSTFARLLADRLRARSPRKTIAILPTDAYMMERAERFAKGITGFDISSHDLASFERDVRSLKSGTAVNVRPYDHSTGKRGQEITIPASDILILEGIFSFYPPVHRLIDYRAFIFSTKPVVKELKFLADCLHRGYTPMAAFKHSEREYGDYEQHVLPFYPRADSVLLVDGYWRYRLEEAEGVEAAGEYVKS